MKQIQELREKRAKVWDGAKAFLDSKRGDDGLISTEDAASYEKMESEVVALGQEIERLERAQAMDRELSALCGAPIRNVPQNPREAKTGRASDEYRDAFWARMRNKYDMRVLNALEEGVDSEGGYLVPDEFENTLVEALDEQNIMRTLATVITTSSGERKIPVVATKGTAAWVEEEGLIPESDDSFGQTSIGAFKLATMVKISDELLNDSAFDMEAYIAKEFARRIGAKEEEAFFVGDGVGKPTGLLAPSAAQIGVTAASATDIKFDEVIDLFYSLKSPYRNRAVFTMNDATIKTIRKLKDSTGQYLWQPSLQVGQPDTIFNRPVYTSIYMPTIAAAAKTIAFGDMSYYWIADRQVRQFKRLNELFATTGQVGFIGQERVDGKLILPEAVKCLQQGA